MDPKQVESTLKSFQTQLNSVKIQSEAMRRDFSDKLKVANTESATLRVLLKKKEDDLKTFQEQAQKDKVEKEKQFKELRTREISDFVESSKKAGKIIPAQEEAVVKLMESMTSEDSIAAFKEKDGSKKSHSQISLFKAFINGLPKRGHLQELTYSQVQEDSSPSDETVTQFMDVKIDGTTISMPVEGQDLDAKAKAFMAEKSKLGITISYADALCAVSPREKAVRQ